MQGDRKRLCRDCRLRCDECDGPRDPEDWDEGWRPPGWEQEKAFFKMAPTFIEALVGLCVMKDKKEWEKVYSKKLNDEADRIEAEAKRKSRRLR